MKLDKYIDKYFNGNKAKFARAFGRTPQHINLMFKKANQWMVLELGSSHCLVQVRTTIKAIKKPPD